ncbi:hypothetical protein BDA96_09G154100 [Sorghum bicolor]|uniref:Uncharacterized protein n=1 Tax=Sorghum bicolor TaxID=4558 RepID=A0A921Q9W8_SORBI|nr:hypothetical protein BDA96_09G154100 [Sorghum bicolor]
MHNKAANTASNAVAAMFIGISMITRIYTSGPASSLCSSQLKGRSLYAYIYTR